MRGVVLAGFLAVMAPGAVFAQVSEARAGVPDVETVGTAQRRIPPDRATVMLFVESKAARRDAEALARALGGSLGTLLHTSAAGINDPRRMNVMMGEMAGGRGTQITPSEIVITAGVITRWQFVPR